MKNGVWEGWRENGGGRQAGRLAGGWGGVCVERLGQRGLEVREEGGEKICSEERNAADPLTRSPFKMVAEAEIRRGGCICKLRKFSPGGPFLPYLSGCPPSTCPEHVTLGEKIEETGRGAGLIFIKHPLGATYCIKYLICVICVITLMEMRKLR